MNQKLLDYLSVISGEEQSILDGHTGIDRSIYMQGQSNTINSQKLLDAGKLITIRPHTRFIDFPEHTHDYVEVVYMCSGQTVHHINHRKILLQEGELLFLNQSVTHEIERAEKEDVAVNFIILPDFFNTTLSALGEEDTPLRKFITGCLCGQNNGPGFLHFRVSEIPTVQNLVENLLWTLILETPFKRKISQMTMALLFLQLTGLTETLSTELREEEAVWKVLRYVETNYKDGSLAEVSELLHYNACWLSREIKRQTGKTYTQLIQEKRLAQAAFLLRNTTNNVLDISGAVGYENISYFHRLFTEAYGKSPKHYRDDYRENL